LQKEQDTNLSESRIFFGKSYRFFGDYLWDKYGCRILKLPINANFSCPNRDGTVGSRGCIFCSEDGSASPTTICSKDIIRQMDFARNNFKRSDALTKYIAYFQAYTNTHGHANNLKEIYNSAINFDDVIGLMIGTRPDCLPGNIIDLIATYKKDDFELWLEIGMQTSHNSSLKFLNRGHSYEDTKDAIKRTAARGIPVCAHIILGIPGESWEDIMSTANKAASLPISGIKFHHLHVIKGTPLHNLHEQGKIKTLSLKEYVSILVDFIERLRPDIIIHRLMGDRNEDSLIAPRWGLHKGTVLNAIDNEFEKRGTWQGFLYNSGF